MFNERIAIIRTAQTFFGSEPEALMRESWKLIAPDSNPDLALQYLSLDEAKQAARQHVDWEDEMRWSYTPCCGGQ